MNRGIERGRMWLVVLFALLGFCVPTVCYAQQSMTDDELDAEMGELSFMTFRAKHVDQVASLLHMDEAQKDAVLSLFKGYRSQVRALYQPVLDQQKAYKEVAAKYQERVEKGDETAFAEYQADIEKIQLDQVDFQQIQRDAFAAQDTFIEDVQLLLDEKQLGAWDRVERWHRRIIMDINFVPLTWLTVDLIDVGRAVELQVEPESELDDVMLRYEKELDTSMVKVWELIHVGMEMDPAEPDMAQQMEIMGTAISLSKALKEVNKRYSSLIERTLPESQREMFLTEVHKRAAPWVYRSSSTERAMEKALSFTDLNSDQAENIRSLQDRYLKEIKIANDKWLRVVEATEKELSIETMMYMFGDEDESVSDAIDVKRQIDAQFRQQLMDQLNDDQIARLPQAFPDMEYNQRFDESNYESAEEAAVLAEPVPAGGG
ncbi:MAG: hypothetical protein H6815_13310 [Phycisphaeraceae bacterium]|nr:hypothetical protein [Phycisphaerales bacterium]MCB9861417.1 hypothetical protein [Phycisphaeraceae bacterium]